MTAIQPAHGRRIAVVLVCVFIVGPALFVGYQALRTLQLLTLVERERDQWQRPADILDRLNIRAGHVVVDLGCGAGYFALKLSPMVGTHGTVLAEDIRRESLAFLWIRRFTRSARNVQVIHGDPDDPHLPSVPLDAALIANTYHELDRPIAILSLLLRALKPGGRLVVVDRGPRVNGDSASDVGSPRHERPVAAVAEEIVRSGFVLVTQDGLFIDRSVDDHVWWLIVASKP